MHAYSFAGVCFPSAKGHSWGHGYGWCVCLTPGLRKWGIRKGCRSELTSISIAVCAWVQTKNSRAWGWRERKGHIQGLGAGRGGCPRQARDACHNQGTLVHLPYWGLGARQCLCIRPSELGCLCQPPGNSNWFYINFLASFSLTFPPAVKFMNEGIAFLWGWGLLLDPSHFTHQKLLDMKAGSFSPYSFNQSFWPFLITLLGCHSSLQFLPALKHLWGISVGLINITSHLFLLLSLTSLRDLSGLPTASWFHQLGAIFLGASLKHLVLEWAVGPPAMLCSLRCCPTN